jgi:hypothetical protein
MEGERILRKKAIVVGSRSLLWKGNTEKQLNPKPRPFPLLTCILRACPDPRPSRNLQFPIAEYSRTVKVRKETRVVDVHPVEILQTFVPTAIPDEYLK